MQNFNVDAAGGKIYVNFNEDISTYTALALKLEPTRGDLIEKTPTLGTVDVEVGDETYLANEYVEYTIPASLFTETDADGNTEPIAEKWRVKAIATLPSAVLVATNFQFFRVMP